MNLSSGRTSGVLSAQAGKRRFRVGCFYTPEYEPIYRENLQASCERLGIPLISLALPTTHSWVANCGLKPTAILELRRQLDPDEWLVYLDVDAQVRREFPLDIPDCRLAVHWLARDDKLPELLSGTIVIPPGQPTTDVLNCWQGWQERRPRDWDQRTLAWALEEFNILDVHRLDMRWCFIHDCKAYHPSAIMGCREDEAYIVHGQASRIMRRKIT
jgi:hypothetical protein